MTRLSKKSKKKAKRLLDAQQEARSQFLIAEINRVQSRLDAKLNILLELFRSMVEEVDDKCPFMEDGPSRCRPAV